MDYLTRNPIAIELVLAEVQSPERGGTCVFLGTVRGGGDGGDDEVTGIDYSAYDEMAVAEITRILDETQARFTSARVMLQHRLGLVPLGEASIAIAAAAPHRDEAFAACRSVIEEVKQRLPIWKKEMHTDGTGTWVDPHGRPHPLAPSPFGEGER